MERFTTLVRAQSAMRDLQNLLTEILMSPALHSRFVNTLSRMEYIGVRKMLKARQADQLDEEGLQHVIEEASHALRLKRAAIQLNGGSAEGVRTYSTLDTLAGPAGEEYMQGVDRGCETLLAGREEMAVALSEANYLLSTAAIEIRAEAFYPLYEECLQAVGAPFSVKGILKDELRHLAEMKESLSAAFPADWDSLMDQAVEVETECFQRWLRAMQVAAESSSMSARS